MGKVYNNTDEVVLEFGDIETDDIGVEMYGLEGLLRSLNDEAYPTERYMTYVLLHESQITP